MPTWSSSRTASLRADRPSVPRCRRTASSTCRPMRCTGLRQLAGSWKIIAIRRPRIAARRVRGASARFSPLSSAWPVTRARDGSSPSAASQVTLLPEPDSPTSPIASPLPMARSMPSTARETRPPVAKSTQRPRSSSKAGFMPSSAHAKVVGAEIHGEGRGGLPGDILALAGKGRVLVQHGIGGVFALADLQHALEHRLALAPVGLGLHRDRQCVHLVIRALADLLLLALRTVLVDDRGDRIGERRAVRPVAHGALAIALEDLLPVLLHLDLHVKTDLMPHLDQDLRGGDL